MITGARRPEPGDQVPRKVDGVELDMRDGVEQCDPACLGAGLPPPRMSRGGNNAGRSGRAGRSGGAVRAPIGRAPDRQAAAT
jgi:hypothetical protein